MNNKEFKIEANKKLIGKTITWSNSGETKIGTAKEVIDHENIKVVTDDNIEYAVDLFDIISTT